MKVFLYLFFLLILFVENIDCSYFLPDLIKDFKNLPKGTVCKDMSNLCPEASKNGRCIKDKKYMDIYCKLSCGVCKDEKLPCNDLNERCPVWIDYCKENEKILESK